MVIAARVAGPAPTRQIAEWIATVPAPPPAPLEWARHALLDWIGVAIAGSREPLARILREEFTANGTCTLLGTGGRTSLHHAALVNGAAGHALDYDDVSREMYGHPTAPVAPALLAVAEATGADGGAILEALAIGIEVECALGEMTGGGHYNLGFHATGTLGSFGAVAACARVLRLDAGRSAHALGLAASMAAGLKVNFGTMAKPLHAGTAAANGLLAARLAARGLTASAEAIEAPQGFLATQAPGAVAAPFRPNPDAPWWIERTLFKYHAACYSTHATIAGVRRLRADHDLRLTDMAALTLTVHPRHLKVCNIGEPRTGLEMKFSLRQLAVAALDGLDTGALTTYSDANACEPRYVAARRRVTVRTDPGRDRMTALVEILLTDGRRVETEIDTGQPARDLDAQWTRLTAKFATLAAPVVGEDRARNAIGAVEGLDRKQSLHTLMRAVS